MRVSRAQAEENRRTVIAEAARLFRVHGFNGIGLNDLMGAAGLTQGGFYKQFKSKDDLAVQACAQALASGTAHTARVVDSAEGDPYAALLDQYLSCAHRDHVGQGCAFAALGPDAARHGPEMSRRFEAGLKAQLETLDRAMRASPALAASGAPNDPLAAFSTMVGALLLSRIVADPALSRRILDAARDSLLGRPGAPGADSRPAP